MLKHNIPDPSLIASGHAQAMKMGPGREWRDDILAPGEEFLATPVFVHTKSVCSSDLFYLPSYIGI